MRRFLCVVLGGMPLACGDDGAAPVEPTSSSSGDASTTTSMPTTTDVADTSTSGSTTTSASSSESTGEQMFDIPIVECGNGYVEVGEDCDDGNDDPLDACPNDCVFPCSVEWELVRSGPTQESDVYGLAVAADGEGGSYAIAYQREITVDEKGMQTIGEVSTLVVAIDDAGIERWSTALAAEALAVRPGAVTVDGDGVPYVSVTREVMDGSTDVQVLRLSPDDGEVIWTHDIVAPAVDGDDEANALAVAPDGTILVSATIAVAENDDDAWLRKLDADGALVWTTSFDGPSEGQYSTDNGGPVAVASDGRVAMLAQAYVDFSASPATLLVFDAGGGEPLFTWSPEDDGGSQELTPIGVGFDADGNVYANYQRVTSQVRFWVVKLDADGEEVWLFDEAQFFSGADASVSAFGVGPSGPVLVGTHIVGDSNDAWAEVWFSQVDLDAAPLCTFSAEGSGGGGVLPPSVIANGGAVADTGRVLAVGQWIDEEEALWVARTRAWGE